MKRFWTLALGADLKNRILAGKGDEVLWGPPLGDLSDVKNFIGFEKAVTRVLKKMTPGPEVIACDLHPNYFSSQYARQLTRRFPKARLLGVQHHHAHIASVMQEHALRGPVLGIAFDGTGFGTDGNIWGGEFLLVDGAKFSRLAHFQYQPMPGGEKVVREPWRMVLGIMGAKGLNFVRHPDKKRILSLRLRKSHAPMSSSVGRLCDAAAALLGICPKARFEAEGPIKLEAMCRRGIQDFYELRVQQYKGVLCIDPLPMFLGMGRDLKKRKDISYLATKFHNTIVQATLRVACRLARRAGLTEIILSGGVFQNVYLRINIMAGLEAAGYKVFMNQKDSCNDFNIALGQYYVSRCSGSN